jgi:catalase
VQGFGVHTFRLVTADGVETFVKFHWRPVLGTTANVVPSIVCVPTIRPRSSAHT